MSRQYAVFTIDGDSPTSTGTQDFTVPGVGSSPVGCVAIVSRTTAYNSLDPDIACSWGATDGVNTVCSHFRSQDNAGTSSADTRTTTDLLRILNPATAAEELVGEFDSFITDGIRINFTTAPGTSYKIQLILYFGSDCETYAFFADAPNVVDTAVSVNTGFEPSYVLTAGAGTDTSNTALLTMQAWFGIALNDGTDLNNSAGCLTRDASGTSASRRALSDNGVNSTVRVNASPPDVISGRASIENYSSSGFDLYCRNTVTGPTIIGLAVRIPSGLAIDVVTSQNFESVTGNATRSGFTALPGFWYTTHSSQTATGVATSGSVAIGFADARLEQYSLAILSQNGVGTTNDQMSIADRNTHLLYGHTGTTLEIGEITSRSNNGDYVVNAKVVAAILRKYHMLIVEELPFECDTLVAIPSVSSALTVDLLFDSTIDAPLGTVGSQVDAEVLMDASVTAALGSVSATVTAELLLDAAINSALRPVSADLSAEIIIDATIAAGLYAIDTATTAELLFDATISAGLGAVDASVTALLQLDAALTAGLPAAAAALVAEIEGELSATIAAGLGAINSDLVAEQSFDATIAAGLAQIAADLEADQQLDATISARLGPVDAALSVDGFLDATIACALAAAHASLTTDLLFDAVIGVQFPKISARLFDFELLGCDTFLLGSSSIITSLLGSSNQVTGLVASSNLLDSLLGSSDRVVNLDASYDGVVDLGGSHC